MAENTELSERVAGQVELGRKQLEADPTSLSIWIPGFTEHELAEMAVELAPLMTEVTSFTFRSGGAQTIPGELINALPKVEWLMLPSGNLVELSDEVAQLFNLKVLDVQGNSLVAIPESLAVNPNLHTVAAQSNKITALPQNLDEWKRLRYLGLSHNPLSGDLSEVLLPPNLGELRLAGTQVTSLPKGLSDLDDFWELGVGSLVRETPPLENSSAEISGLETDGELPRPSGQFDGKAAGSESPSPGASTNRRR